MSNPQTTKLTFWHKLVAGLFVSAGFMFMFMAIGWVFGVSPYPWDFVGRAGCFFTFFITLTTMVFG